MKLKKCKIFTALLLVIALTVSPMSLFASVWDDERGQAFQARLTELMTEMHADWVVEDLEILREHNILSDEEFYALVDMGVDAALEYYLAPQLLEEFWDLDDSGRFWLLFDHLLSLGVWMDWGGDWGSSWVWEPSPIWQEEGLELKTQLIELLGEVYASWITEDIYRERVAGGLDDETFAEILAFDIMALLSDNMTPEDLAEIMELDEFDRQDFLYDVLWWDILAPMIFDWWGDWDWTPTFSGIWFDVGQALRVQLIDLLGEPYAIWFAEDLDWERNFLGEAVFFEILGLNLTEFIAEHMTEEEINQWQAQEDGWLIYRHLWNLLLSVYSPDWGGWDSDWSWELSPIWEEEGLALKTQMTELLGEHEALWVAGELDWYRELGRIQDDTWAEILAMDVMAALEEYLTDEELEEFFADENVWRGFDFWDFILRPMIIADWADVIEISREEFAARFEILAVAGHFEQYGIDLHAMLDAAEIEIADLIDLMHFFLTVGGPDATMWYVWQWGEDWLYYYFVETLEIFSLMLEGDAFFLRMLAGAVIIHEILGENEDAFYELAIFNDIFLVFGNEALADALYANPNEEVLQTYGEELLTILDFELYDVLSEFFAAEDDEWPHGLAVLDALLNGLLSDNIDALYEFYTEGPPIAIMDTLALWRYLEDWGYIILGEEDLEERLAFDVAVNTEFALDLIHIMDLGTHLNLFYANNADSHVYLGIEFADHRGGLTERIIRVDAGTSATIRLTADELAVADMVWVLIVNTEWEEVSGEFALRKTEQPLP